MDSEPLQPVPRAVIFDLDDTLCDYTSARQNRLRHAFTTAIAMPESAGNAELVQKMIDASIDIHPFAADHFPELFADFGVGTRERALQAADWYRHNRFHTLHLFPAAVDVLLRARTTTGSSVVRPVGIVTNGPADVQRDKVALLEIAPLVDFVLISEEFGAAKPERSIFAAALARADVAAAEAVFIGDSAEHDMAGAAGIGMQTIWISRDRAPWPGFGPVPDRVVSNIGEVPHLIGSA